MRTHLNTLGRFYVQALIILLLSSLSAVAFSDAHTKYQSLNCVGCHGELDDFTLSPGYTHATLETWINDTMPENDPGLCTGDCAHDLANELLNPDGVNAESSVIAAGSPIVSTAPNSFSFIPGRSSCPVGPCVFEWDFGDGSTFTQTTSDPNSLPTFSHDFPGEGNYHITLTITDTSTGDSDYDESYVFLTQEESFSDYVETCKSALNFTESDVPNDLNCATGFLFANDGGRAVNDYVGHRSITDQVDLVFACRWLQNDNALGTDKLSPPFVMSQSVELLMHNRVNGETCFFRAKEQPFTLEGGTIHNAVPVELVPPTVSATAAAGSPEAEFWDTPMELAQSLPCVDCHAAGPYIATPRIAPFLQRFGLLNDGHDTFGRIKTGANTTDGNYHIAGTTFAFMNTFAAYQNNQNTCANGCHAIQDNSPKNSDIIASAPGSASSQPAVLIPSINSVLSPKFHNNPEVTISSAGVMPANAPSNGDSPDWSDYTWINRDTPLANWDDSDVETFAAAKSEFASLLNYCGDPGEILAHVVGSDTEIYLPQFSDELETFNAQDGVICRNSSQGDGQCNDFRVRYQCTDSSGSVSMTNWYNTDSPSYDGDFERRSDHNNVCVGAEVTGIEASSTISTGWTSPTPGPVDRLAQFDRYGLICNNTEQDDGQCDNYVVKFIGCSDAPVSSDAKIESAWSGRLLTAAGSGNNADTRAQPENGGWDTQDWSIEPVTGTVNVRIKNISENRFLNAENNSNYADVVLYDYQEDWGSQQWLIENITGSAEVRFRNVWSGNYLTASDNGDYADIKAQPLNPAWPSQRWNIQN